MNPAFQPRVGGMLGIVPQPSLQYQVLQSWYYHVNTEPMGYALTAKSQVTVPKAIRQQLGVEPGQQIQYHTLSDGRVVISAAKPSADAKGKFAKWRGVGVQHRSTDAIMRDTRGDDWNRKK
jgi:antitoxin PrlF